jgi:hypothetical protein
MGKRDEWKRCDHGYDLIRDGEVVGTVYRASSDLWCWESYVSPHHSFEHWLCDAKKMLVESVNATLEDNDGQA